MKVLFSAFLWLVFSIPAVEILQEEFRAYEDGQIENYEIHLHGESNARDWDAKVTDLSMEFELSADLEGGLGQIKPEDFKKLSLEIPATAIQAEGSRLTRHIHEELNAEEYPVIRFDLQRIDEIEASGDGRSAKIHATVVINAAGTDNQVEMEVDAELLEENILQFSGVQQLKMTGFNIDPPRRMLGVIRADDEFTVEYRFRLNAKKTTGER